MLSPCLPQLGPGAGGPVPQGKSGGLLRVALGLDQQLEPRGSSRPEPGVGGFLGRRGCSPPPALAAWACCHEAPSLCSGHARVSGRMGVGRAHALGSLGSPVPGCVRWGSRWPHGVVWPAWPCWLLARVWLPSSQGQALQPPPTQAWVPQAGRGPTCSPQRAQPGAGGSGSEPQALLSRPCAKASMGDTAGWGRGGRPESSWGGELGRVPHGFTLPPPTRNS